LPIIDQPTCHNTLISVAPYVLGERRGGHNFSFENSSSPEGGQKKTPEIIRGGLKK